MVPQSRLTAARSSSKHDHCHPFFSSLVHTHIQLHGKPKPERAPMKPEAKENEYDTFFARLTCFVFSILSRIANLLLLETIHSVTTRTSFRQPFCLPVKINTLHQQQEATKREERRKQQSGVMTTTTTTIVSEEIKIPTAFCRIFTARFA
jgi:hypothetical protein